MPRKGSHTNYQNPIWIHPFSSDAEESGGDQRTKKAVRTANASVTVTVRLCSAAARWRLPGAAFLTLISVMAGTVTRSEAVRTAALRNVTTRSPPRTLATLLRRWPEPLRTVIPRARSRARLAKRTCLEGTTTIDWIAGALVPAPTFSDSDGRPLALTVSPPVIVGRPAMFQAIAAWAVEPDASVTVIVVLALPARLGPPVISPVPAASDSPAGSPAAW